MKAWILGLLALTSFACTAPERLPSKPSRIFEGKKFAVMMVEPAAGVPFRQEQLNRMVWYWSESSPWFREQLVGISSSVPSSGSISKLLDSIEPTLRSHSELLVVLQPRQFRVNGSGGNAVNSRYGGGQSGPTSDLSEFLVALVDVRQEQEIGNFVIRSSPSVTYKEDLLEKAAYEIANRVGFGWTVVN